MSTATSLLGAERLDRFLASPAALFALSGGTATEGTVLIEMADIDGGAFDGAIHGAPFESWSDLSNLRVPGPRHIAAST